MTNHELQNSRLVKMNMIDKMTNTFINMTNLWYSSGGWGWWTYICHFDEAKFFSLLLIMKCARIRKKIETIYLQLFLFEMARFRANWRRAVFYIITGSYVCEDVSLPIVNYFAGSHEEILFLKYEIEILTYFLSQIHNSLSSFLN
jgi:hypothetical protein